MTQKEKILQAFAENNNVLTPGDIMRLGIAQYNARIFELKEQGHIIENEDLGYVEGVHLTQFVYRGMFSRHAFQATSNGDIYETARRIREEREAKENEGKGFPEQLLLF